MGQKKKTASPETHTVYQRDEYSTSSRDSKTGKTTDQIIREIQKTEERQQTSKSRTMDRKEPAKRKRTERKIARFSQQKPFSLGKC